jgi:hypothetical protein
MPLLAAATCRMTMAATAAATAAGAEATLGKALGLGAAAETSMSRAGERNQQQYRRIALPAAKPQRQAGAALLGATDMHAPTART